MAKTFDGPPTLEQSGSEHREGTVTSLALLERARAWEWVKDPPAGEGQVGKYSTVGRLHPLVPEGFCPPELGEPKGV